MTTIVQKGRKADVGQVVFDLAHNRSEPLDFLIEVVYPNSNVPADYTEPEVAFNNGSVYVPVVGGAFTTPANIQFINFRFKLNNDNRIVEDNFVHIQLTPAPGNQYITNTDPLIVSMEIVDAEKFSNITGDTSAVEVMESATLEVDYQIAPPLFTPVTINVSIVAGTGSAADFDSFEYTTDGVLYEAVPSDGNIELTVGVNGFSIGLNPKQNTTHYNDKSVTLRMHYPLRNTTLNKPITIKNTDNHPAGELITSYCIGFDLTGLYHDGNGGSYEQVITVNSPGCGFLHPAAGEVLDEFCAGYDLMQHVADGNGGRIVRTQTYNSATCGYTPPIPNPQTTVTPTNWDPATKGVTVALTENNTVFSGLYRDGVRSVYSTMFGKWYWEVQVFFPTVFHRPPAIGVVTAAHAMANWIGSTTQSWAWWPHESRAYHNDLEKVYGAPITTGDVISVIYDSTAHTLRFWLNGIDQGIAYSNLPAFVKIFAATNAIDETYSITNFGKYEFKYTPPADSYPGLGIVADAPIERGVFLRNACVDVNRINFYADGRYGEYTSVNTTNDPTCGYVPPPPPAGTELGFVCVGVDRYKKIADGVGGFTQVLYQSSSTDCGYVAPPLPSVTFAKLSNSYFSGGTTFSNGDTSAAMNSSVRSTNAVNSGRWYWEMTVDSNNAVIGIGVNVSSTVVVGKAVNTFGWSLATQELFVANTVISAPALPIPAPGDVIGVFLDFGAETLQFSLNNVVLSPVISGLGSLTYYAMASSYLNSVPVNLNTFFDGATVVGVPDSRFVKGFGVSTVGIPSKGTTLSYYCVGQTYMVRKADGVQGSYAEILQSPSTSCGWVPPRPAGELKNYLCKGEHNTDRYGVYHDGNYGTYETLIQLRSVACGYRPAGDLISSFCEGTTKNGTFSDGEFSSYVEIMETNSVECGYNPGGGSTEPPPGAIDPTIPVESKGAVIFSTTATHTDGALIFKP